MSQRIEWRFEIAGKDAPALISEMSKLSSTICDHVKIHIDHCAPGVITCLLKHTPGEDVPYRLQVQSVNDLSLRWEFIDLKRLIISPGDNKTVVISIPFEEQSFDERGEDSNVPSLPDCADIEINLEIKKDT